MAKPYCLAQEHELKQMKERRMAAMQRCVDYKNKQHDLLAEYPELLKQSKLCQRDALLMEHEMKKQKITDYSDLMNFRYQCKSYSYGREGKFRMVGIPIDYSKYEGENGPASNDNPYAEVDNPTEQAV